MFYYVRKLLVQVRKINAHLTNNQKWLSLAAAVAVSILGMLVDHFVPFNYGTNIIRAALAVVLGLYLFASVYLLLIRRKEKKISESDVAIEDTDTRESFSYSQRVNISVVLWGVFVVLALLGSRPNPFFTLFSGFLIAYALGIMAFVRSTRDETQTASIGLRDPRDISFDERVSAELKFREEEEERLKGENPEDKKVN